MRLLLPQLERERDAYGIKEVILIIQMQQISGDFVFTLWHYLLMMSYGTMEFDQHWFS